MQLMNVEGLTRENVASHLQKYRLQLRRDPSKVAKPTLSIRPTLHAAMMWSWGSAPSSLSGDCGRYIHSHSRIAEPCHLSELEHPCSDLSMVML